MRGVGNIDKDLITYKVDNINKIDNSNKIDNIIRNELFLEHLKNIESFEVNREFCNHDMVHFLDVARLMYIEVLEDNLDIPKHIIYATALLHDIGRALEYEKGIPHHIASSEIATLVLKDCKYNKDEIEGIIKAIENHRDYSMNQGKSLSYLLYKNDKLSRACFSCNARAKCKWSNDKKNLVITK